ncbi:MAG: 16S rRNA (adenine(1518)-N(6)/adenine(1519)-N(6))-dimethyltransferase RsmA [Elusimicrobium sp.]|jgi:16S rRNA (adenine1518-N6/adenine1519-N6)-dimethyltransferase|nr:16S rRNA (adenine(1518)-N(6)/adenine(1519)-N(6))-dimethyltransferase RsmA [Elusimicrobium sp.]
MRQKYGQNFLVNRGVIDKICGAAVNLSRGKILVEIGPGRGALTAGLLERGARGLQLVEIDPEMVKILRASLPAGADINIFEKDFLDFNLNLLPRGDKFFMGNLPYIAAAEILDKVLAEENLSGAVFMFQREMARRITAARGREFYGPLSLLSQARANIESLCRVSPGSFNPPPKVESEVLVFTPERKIPPAEFPVFKKIVNAAFAHKRKNILNSLTENLKVDKTALAETLSRAKIAPNARAQELAFEDYLNFLEAVPAYSKLLI